MSGSHSKPTKRELTLITNLKEITPIEKPLFPFDIASPLSPKDYLPQDKAPFGKKVAEWKQKFFGLPTLPTYTTQPEITPMWPGAPTVVAVFYTVPQGASQVRRPIDIYLERIQNLAKMNHQTIIYVSPEISAEVRSYRKDKWWIVIDKYETIWDFPNNMYQKKNFETTQPELFKTFDGWDENSSWKPNPAYSFAHASGTYNSKVFITYDAVMRNPFGSDKWAYMDAGLFDQQGPTSATTGEIWGDLFKEKLDDSKFERAISVSKDSGIVIGEYSQSEEYGKLDINHQCFTDPKKAWLALHFIANVWVGNSLGMLNYAVRFMQTVDDLDANQRYTGREEMVVPWVACRYPNTVFSVPRLPFPGPPGMDCANYYPMKWCFTTWGGPGTVPAIVDPIETLFCNDYKSQRQILPAEGLLKEKPVSFKEFPHLNPHDQPLKEFLQSDAPKVDRDRLTFGVELEFTIVGLEEQYKDPTPHDPRSVRGVLGSSRPSKEDSVNIKVLEHIADVLNKANIPAEARKGTPPSAVNPIDNPWTAKDQRSWVVTTDESIEAPKNHGTDYFFHKIEITSPAFYFGKTTLEAVSQVCGVLSTNFRIHMNETMALHVHVGNKTKGFTTECVRGAIATAFTFEPQIEKIHPEYFRGEYKYGPNLRDHSRLRNLQESDDPLPGSGTGFSQHQVFERESRYLTASLGKIHNAKTTKSLQQLIHHKNPTLEHPRMSYNINNLVEPQPGTIGIKDSKKTIEFRQHEGTIDPTRVTNWVRFCAGLMEFADTCEPETLRKFTARNIHDRLNIMNMKMICDALGMWDIAQYYHEILGEGESSVFWREDQTKRQRNHPRQWVEGWRNVQEGFNELDGKPVVTCKP